MQHRHTDKHILKHIGTHICIHKKKHTHTDKHTQERSSGKQQNEVPLKLRRYNNKKEKATLTLCNDNGAQTEGEREIHKQTQFALFAAQRTWQHTRGREGEGSEVN